MVRPPLKKILFPVRWPGVYITGEWELFFFILPPPPPNFWVKISSFSYPPPPPQKKTPKKTGKKKDFAAARLATISVTRWTGNKLFFKGGLRIWREMGHFSIQNGTGGVSPYGYVFWGHSPIWVQYLASDEATALIYCKRRYFRAAKFSRI